MNRRNATVSYVAEIATDARMKVKKSRLRKAVRKVRLIDADALMSMVDKMAQRALKENPPKNETMKAVNDGYAVAIASAKELVEYAPTIKSIVRCKDCKYWQAQEVGIVECSVCTRIHDMVFEMDADGFCSFGERKGGDDE